MFFYKKQVSKSCFERQFMTMGIVLKTICVNSRIDFVFALMKCSKAAFGEQKQGMNLQQHKQHDSTIIPLATTQLAAGIVLRQFVN